MAIFYYIALAGPYIGAILTSTLCLAGLGRIRVCLACWLTSAFHAVAWYLGSRDEEYLAFTFPAMLAFGTLSLILFVIEIAHIFQKQKGSMSENNAEKAVIPESIHVSWTEESMYKAADRILQEHTAAKYLYIEGLDSSFDAANIVRVLKVNELQADLIDGQFPIVSICESSLKALDDIRIFPGYDTIWILESLERLKCPPPARLEISSYEEGYVPGLREGRSVNPWSALADWMEASGVSAGLAFGSLLVTVERNSGLKEK